MIAAENFIHSEPCPDPTLFSCAVAGLLTESEVDRICEHLAICMKCLDKFDAMFEKPAPQQAGIFSGIDRPKRPGENKAREPWITFRQFGDRFEIIRKLGSGGMGEVFECVDGQLQRHVAVKKIRPEKLDPDLMLRLDREAKIQSGLNHPGIVQIYEVGQWAGSPFLAMELVPGQSLKEKLSRSPLPPWQAALIVMQVARALEFAHERQVIHRDLKPSNILLPQEPMIASGKPSASELQQAAATQIAKLADFGLAKIIGSDFGLTQSGMIVGTLAYLAPEQVSSEKKNTTSLADIYSLGIVLYECLTGHPPFESHEINITIAMIESMAPVSPRVVSPEISKDLETICLKCLEKDPAQRYASAGALADDLSRYLGGQPIMARPISLFMKASRWCGRNRATAAALFFSLICLLLLTGGSLYYANREAQLSRAAFEEAEKSRRAESLAIQAELDARRESDLSRNMLFSSLKNLSRMNEKLDDPRTDMTSPEMAKSLKRESVQLIESTLSNFLNRPTMRGEPKGPLIDRLFLDGISIRDFGDTDKALFIFERLRAMARDCPPEHPDFLRRRAAACRAATTSAMILADRGEKTRAIDVAEEAWLGWPIPADAKGADAKMLYDRTTIGNIYAKLLKDSGRFSQAEAVLAEVSRIEADMRQLNAAKTGPAKNP